MRDINEVIDVVSKLTHVPVEHMRSERKLKSITIARQAVYLLARRYTILGCKEIAAALNRRSHSTVVKCAATSRSIEVDRVCTMAEAVLKD